MGAAMQPSEVNASSVTIMGNKTVKILPLDVENNRNEPANIPPSHDNDIEFDIPNVQVTVSSSDEEDLFY